MRCCHGLARLIRRRFYLFWRLCRSDSDGSDSEDDERKKKPIPKWARGQALAQALASQNAVDPDEIFKLHQKTCPLNEVFSHPTGDAPFSPPLNITRLCIFCCIWHGV